MIAVECDVVLLEPDNRIMVVEKHDVSLFQKRNTLPMYSRSVEEKCSPGRAREFQDLRRRHVRQIGGANPSWMLLAMGAPDVVEGAALYIGQIETELYFLWNIFCRLLVVPFISVPPVKIPLGRQGSPASCFNQREATQIPAQYCFDNRMEGHLEESLVKGQHVLDHMAVRFGLLVPVEIVPA